MSLLQISRTTIYRMFDPDELTKIEIGKSVQVKAPGWFRERLRESNHTP